MSSSKYIAHFPMALFAIIMGLSGFCLAWVQSPWHMLLPKAFEALTVYISIIFSVVVIALFIFITILLCLRIIYCKEEVKKDLKHPVKLNFFAAVSVSLILISNLLLFLSHNIAFFNIIGFYLAQSVFVLGAFLHFALTLFTFNSWLNHPHYKIESTNPAWFIPVVGNIIVPLAAMQYNHTLTAYFFFSIGFIFWLILFTIILYRLFFHEPLPAKLTPMLCILLAPPSIGFVSYLAISNNSVDLFAIALYSMALFIFLLLMLNIKRLAKAPFFLSAWAFSFPLAAFAIASSAVVKILLNQKIYAIVANSFYAIVFILLNVVIYYLIIRTLVLLKKDKIFIED